MHAHSRVILIRIKEALGDKGANSKADLGADCKTREVEPCQAKEEEKERKERSYRQRRCFFGWGFASLKSLELSSSTVFLELAQTEKV